MNTKSEEVKSTELASIIRTRLEDISDRKSQTEVANEVGFNSNNVLSIIKKGATKLSLDRVEAMAKALDLDVATLLLPALRQYYSDDVINMIRDVFVDGDTKTEREIINIARKHMDTRKPLSFEARELLKEVFEDNKPAGH